MVVALNSILKMWKIRTRQGVFMEPLEIAAKTLNPPPAMLGWLLIIWVTDSQPTGLHPLLCLTAWCGLGIRELHGCRVDGAVVHSAQNDPINHFGLSFQLSNPRTSCRSFKKMFSVMLCLLSSPVLPAWGRVAHSPTLLTRCIVYCKCTFLSSPSPKPSFLC